MSEDLKRIRQQLRSERCPAAVLERVHDEVARQERSHVVLRLSWALAAVALLIALSFPIARWSNQQTSPVAEGQPVSRDQEVREQAKLALAVIGGTINRAGDQSREKILEVSLPRLRQGLRTARKAISLEPKTNTPHRNTVP